MFRTKQVFYFQGDFLEGLGLSKTKRMLFGLELNFTERYLQKYSLIYYHSLCQISFLSFLTFKLSFCS